MPLYAALGLWLSACVCHRWPGSKVPGSVQAAHSRDFAIECKSCKSLCIILVGGGGRGRGGQRRRKGGTKEAERGGGELGRGCSNRIYTVEYLSCIILVFILYFCIYKV